MKNRLILVTAVVFATLILIAAVVFTLRLFSGEDNWICQNGQWVKHGNPSAPMPSSGCFASPKSPEISDTSNSSKTPEVVAPISDAKSRVTKKPFGIYITPATSPVQPEKFTGYHTGVDFEITSDEKTKNIDVFAICTGEILKAEKVSGYGGVIIQQCTVEGSPVTVLYGHVILPDIAIGPKTAGEKLTILAPANSEFSGGERKHLHLGIHKGTGIEYRGYVDSQSQLSAWTDILKYL